MNVGTGLATLVLSTKRVAVVGALVGALTLGALPAWAHMTFFQATARAALSPSHEEVSLGFRFTTQCDPGETISFVRPH